MKLLPTEFPATIKKGNCSVRIYKNSNKGYIDFKLAYYNKVGKRLFETHSNLSKAVQAATKIVTSFSSGNLDSLTLTNEECLIYQRAKDALRLVDVPLDAAVQEFAEAKKLLGSDSLVEAIRLHVKTHKVVKIKTVQEVVNELLEEKETRSKRPASAEYLEDLRHRLRRFADYHQCDIRVIGADEMRAFLDSLKVSGRTWFNYARVIRTLFRFAQTRKYYPKDLDPFEGIDLKFDDDSEIEIFTPKELRRLFELARPEIIPFLAIAAFAGLRHQEICRLDWQEVLASGYIEVKKSKAKVRSRRLIPITENLKKWIAVYRQESGPVTPFVNMPKQLAFVSAATSEMPSNPPENYKPFEVKWRHNALRHSFISYRLAVIGDENRVAMEAGNSPAMIYQNYRQLVTLEQAQEWFNITPDCKPI